MEKKHSPLWLVLHDELFLLSMFGLAIVVIVALVMIIATAIPPSIHYYVS